MQKLDTAIIAISNFVTKMRKKKQVKPKNILLLFSSCLQSSKCKENLNHDVWNCKRCGACVVKELLELAELTGVRPFMATGGSIALKEARKEETKAIVAVACEKELREGILASLPKAVLAVVNLRPCGPCRDCTAKVAEVEAAVNSLLKKDDQPVEEA